MGFEEFLRGWIEQINNRDDVDKIILDNEYFSYDEKNKKYTLNSNVVNKIKKTKYIFIGDNPGNNEAINRKYFYYCEDKNWLKKNKSAAGVKFHKFIERLDSIDKDKILIFNKCLFSTAKTSKLKKSDIESSKDLVCEFINNLVKLDANIKIIFMGLSKNKFDSVYKNIKTDNIVFIPHPCNSMYKHDGEVIIEDKNNIKLETFYKSWKDVNIIIEIKGNDEDNNGALITAPV